MKKTITFLALLIFGISKGQVVSDFESFSLPADSFYYNASGADWQTTNASFHYDYNFGYWSAGFAYTNKNNVDSGNYRHLYNCITGKGYNLSNYYATGQPGAIIRIKAPSTSVNGFYVTNTTYAYKSMKNGDSFSTKFGDSTAAHSGYPKGSYPDFLKLTVKGYSGGTLKPDSTEFYLADFRFSNNTQDYILKAWQWVDCTNLGAVDSVTFFMYSSDNSFGFMNTPGFFSIDNFTTAQGVGIAEVSFINSINLFPNPTNGVANLKLQSENAFSSTIKIYNSIGALLKTETVDMQSGLNNYPIDLSNYSNGIYFIELLGDNKRQNFKLVKN